MIKIALGLSLKGTWHSAMSENLIKPVENEDFWQANDHQFAIPRGARSAPRIFWGHLGAFPKKIGFSHLWGQNLSTLGANSFSLCEAPPQILSLKFLHCLRAKSGRILKFSYIHD